MPTTTNKTGKSGRYCSFCGRSESQVGSLVLAPTGIFICEYCVDACAQILDETQLTIEEDTGFTLDTLPRPTQIKAALD